VSIRTIVRQITIAGEVPWRSQTLGKLRERLRRQ
jgi:hypothetical protein